jgi:hypothetical protein
MAVPQEKTTSYAAKAASGQSSFLKILYCTVVFATLLTGIVSSGLVAAAQEDRPQITPAERRGPRKKDAAEPRAVALLKLSSDGKSSLVPIAILINGKFWDAGSYKASPVPMALEPGTVYEAERSGSSLGLFTVNTALHSNAVNAPIPWLGTGAWVPTGTDTGKKGILPAESAPVGIDNSDAPPRLTKNPSASTTAPTSAPSGNNAPASTPSSTPSSSPSTSTPSSGDEPPRLTKPATQQAPPANPPSTSTPSSSQTSTGSAAPPGDSKSSSTSNQSGSSQPGQDTSANKPADSKNDSKPDTSKSDDKQGDRSNTPVSDSGADEANRPRLRRGKPAQSFADEDIPGYSKLGAKPSSSSSATVAKVAPTGPVQLIPAISDSAGPDPHSYGFEWLKGEEGERRQQLITLAQEQVRAYVDAKAKATISAKTVPSKTAPTPASHHVPVKKSAPPVLTNVQMTAYDLWSTNVPVVIFSAQAQMPPASQSASSATSSASSDDLQYSVLIVAYPDIYNNLHKLYAGVTDKYHLDLTPRLDLIDAVDADGDGRGELLFNETSDAGSGWVIYRATADKLWKMYDSLNPE